MIPIPFDMLMPGRQWGNIDSTYQDSVSSILHYTDFEDPIITTNQNGKNSVDGWRPFSGSEVEHVNEEIEVSNTNCTHGALQRFPCYFHKDSGIKPSIHRIMGHKVFTGQPFSKKGAGLYSNLWRGTNGLINRHKEKRYVGR